MMTNWHSVVIGPISAVNPQTSATISTSTGFTIAADGTQTPTYTTASGLVHVTAPDLKESRELTHHANLNLEGTVRKIYAYGNLVGAVRVSEKGGDLLVIAAGVNAGTWKIVRVFETWAGDWCSFGAQLQVDVP